MRTQATQTEPNELHPLYDHHHQHRGLSTSLFVPNQVVPIEWHQSQNNQNNYSYVTRRSVSHQFLSSSTLVGDCCPTGFFDTSEDVILNHHHYSSSKSLRSSSAHKVETQNQHEYSDNDWEEEDDDSDDDNYSSSTNNTLSPKVPIRFRSSYHSYVPKQYRHLSNKNRHQFIIRTIPSYLNLSPRASYHRLNIKHPPNEIHQRWKQRKQHQQMNISPGDTILMCCSMEDSLWEKTLFNAKPTVGTSKRIVSNRNRQQQRQQQTSAPPVAAFTSNTNFIDKQQCQKKQPQNRNLKPPIPTKPKHIITKNGPILERNFGAHQQKVTLPTAAPGTLEYAEQLSLEIIRAVEHSSNVSSCSRCGIVNSLILPPPPKPPPPPINTVAMFKQQPGSIATIEWSMQPTDAMTNMEHQWKTPVTTVEQLEFKTNQMGTTGNSLDNYSACSNSIYPQSLIEHKSFSESELYLQSRPSYSIQNIKNILNAGLHRRHSAIADLAVDTSVFETIATPPPGFEDQISTVDSVNSLNQNIEGNEVDNPQNFYVYKSTKKQKDTNVSSHSSQLALLSIISPESEQSSQVTSVTNCSELLETTGTTFSSEGTGSGGYPIDEFGRYDSPGPSTKSGKFKPSNVLAGTAGLIMVALDFDDDEDIDYNDDDEENEVYEMDITESGQNEFIRGFDVYPNADFAMAEGSSQDEEKANYEFEFDTTEDEVGNDEYDNDNILDSKEPDLLTLNLTSKLKRPNELDVVPLVNQRRTTESHKHNYNSSKAIITELTEPSAPLYPHDVLSPTNVTSRVGHGTSKSLPENLFRTVDEPEILKQMSIGNDERVRLSRTKSSTFDRRRNSQGKFFGYQVDKGRYRYSQRFESIDSRNDLTPLQDIYSSDPSTTIDLSIANTVIEKRGEDKEEIEIDAKEPLQLNIQSEKTKKFSTEIFEKLNITPEKYINDNHKEKILELWECASASANDNVEKFSNEFINKQDTFDENTTTTSHSFISNNFSKREDVPLLSNNNSCENMKSRMSTDSLVRQTVLKQVTTSDNDNSSKTNHSYEYNCRYFFENECSHYEHRHRMNKKNKKSNSNVINNKKKCSQKSIYDSRPNSRYQSCEESDENNDEIEKSQATKTSSVDSDSPTFSVENLPEDSTTSGSFMLDDANSETLNGSYFISDSNSGSTSKNFLTGSNDLKDSLMNSYNVRVGKSEPVFSSRNETNNINFQSLPSKIDQNVKQIGGENPNILRLRFEQRQQKALQRREKSDNSSQEKSLSKTNDNEIDQYEDEDVTDNFFGQYQKILDSQYEEPTDRIISTGISPRQHTQSLQMLLPSKSKTINQSQSKDNNNINNFIQYPTVSQVNNNNQILPQPYCNITDMFEQSSQATERDVERSEFSLQNQNSEFDEDESLTFENLNNQSLSVIDEDSKGDQDSEERGKHLNGDENLQKLSHFDSGEKSSKSIEIEDRDLSLEAVLREESKELERVRLAGHKSIDTYNDHSSFNKNEANTLMEEVTCHTSTFQQTTEDSSRDIHMSNRPEDEERTELRDEHVALLISGANDSSEYSPRQLLNISRNKFDEKLQEIERRIRNENKKENSSEVLIQEQYDENNSGSKSLEELEKKTKSSVNNNNNTNNEPGESTFSSTCSHNNSTYDSECSSMTTDKCIRPNVEVPISILKPTNKKGISSKAINVMFANKPGSESLLSSHYNTSAHCCSRCYYRHHQHHYHHQQRQQQYHHQKFNICHKSRASTSKQQTSSQMTSCPHHQHHYYHYHHRHDPNKGNYFEQQHLRSQKDNIIIQARARSLTRNLAIDQYNQYYPENVQAEFDREKTTHFQSPRRLEKRKSPCSQHHFTCSHCGESTMPPNLMPITTSQSRFKRKGMPQLSRKSFTVEDVYFDVDDEENDIGVHSESYRSSLWIYIGRKEELNIWNNLNRAVLNRSSGKKHCRFSTTVQTDRNTNNTNNNDDNDNNNDSNNSNNNNNSSTNTENSMRSESEESTASEKNFRQRYETVTHRLIHRKASIELYRRILHQTFTIDKCLTLTRDNNEFGFRIHGNRPVVVSAVEKGTSAQHKGLEVGDIIVAVNGHTVLDSSHSEVVRMAHYGHSLKLEVASTASALRNETVQASENEPKVIINGYLSRFIDKLAEKGNASRDKMNNPKLWRRRWFVLKSDACLYWYRNPKSLEPIGAISLQGYCAGIVNECLFGQEHLFRLVGLKTSRSKYLAAIDHATAVQWVKALNQNSIQYSNRDAFIENTLHNIHRNPLNFINPDCYGFLWKFNQIKKNWKQRYFVLKDASLYFYADANSTTALGLFFLHGYRVQVSNNAPNDKQPQQSQQTNNEKRDHMFEIVPSDPKYRHIWLCADSESDRKRWTYALEYSIDRWIRLK